MKRAPKAYKNVDFLTSSQARTLRILAEYLEPKKRFDTEKIKHTIVFFGSSRAKSDPPNDPSDFDSSKYYWAAEEFAFKLAAWSKELEKDGMVLPSVPVGALELWKQQTAVQLAPMPQVSA